VRDAIPLSRPSPAGAQKRQNPPDLAPLAPRLHHFLSQTDHFPAQIRRSLATCAAPAQERVRGEG
jgi:hypothetical protein